MSLDWMYRRGGRTPRRRRVCVIEGCDVETAWPLCRTHADMVSEGTSVEVAILVVEEGMSEVEARELLETNDG